MYKKLTMYDIFHMEPTSKLDSSIGESIKAYNTLTTMFKTEEDIYKNERTYTLFMNSIYKLFKIVNRGIDHEIASPGYHVWYSKQIHQPTDTATKVFLEDLYRIIYDKNKPGRVTIYSFIDSTPIVNFKRLNGCTVKTPIELIDSSIVRDLTNTPPSIYHDIYTLLKKCKLDELYYLGKLLLTIILRDYILEEKHLDMLITSDLRLGVNDPGRYPTINY